MPQFKVSMNRMSRSRGSVTGQKKPKKNFSCLHVFMYCMFGVLLILLFTAVMVMRGLSGPVVVESTNQNLNRKVFSLFMRGQKTASTTGTSTGTGAASSSSGSATTTSSSSSSDTSSSSSSSISSSLSSFFSKKRESVNINMLPSTPTTEQSQLPTDSSEINTSIQVETDEGDIVHIHLPRHSEISIEESNALIIPEIPSNPLNPEIREPEEIVIHGTDFNGNPEKHISLIQGGKTGLRQNMRVIITDENNGRETRPGSVLDLQKREERRKKQEEENMKDPNYNPDGKKKIGFYI